MFVVFFFFLVSKGLVIGDRSKRNPNTKPQIVIDLNLHALLKLKIVIFVLYIYIYKCSNKLGLTCRDRPNLYANEEETKAIT